jgi:serine protease Do
MFRKSLALFLLGVATGAVVYGQQTPEPRKDSAPPAVRSFAWTFDGDGGYLGIQTADVNRENYGKYGLRDVRGVAVEKVLENSPAAAAGIQAGDVIVRFDGEEITGVRKLTRLISEVAPDHQVRLTLLRNGRESEVTATLGKRPAPKFESGNFNFDMPVAPGKIEMPDLPDMPQVPDLKNLPNIRIAPNADGDTFFWRSGSSRRIGVSVSPVTKQLGDHFGVAEGALLINNVRENSPAARAGLKAGDIIVEVDGKAVTGDLDLIRALGAKKEGDVELTIVRDKNRQTVRVTPEAMKGDLAPLLDSSESFSPLAPALPGPTVPAMRGIVPVPPVAPMPFIGIRPGPRIL